MFPAASRELSSPALSLALPALPPVLWVLLLPVLGLEPASARERTR